jgi:hypothetical protein
MPSIDVKLWNKPVLASFHKYPMQKIFLIFFLLSAATGYSQLKRNVVPKINGKDTVYVEKPFAKDTFEKNSQKYILIEQMPDCPFDLNAYFAKNLKLEDTTLSRPEYETIYVRFLIRSNGSIDSVRIVEPETTTPFDYQHPHQPLPIKDQKKILSVFKTMPPWHPGKKNRQPVDVWFTYKLRIHWQ